MGFFSFFMLTIFISSAISKILPVQNFYRAENFSKLDPVQNDAVRKQYLQIPVTKNMFYYTPLEEVDASQIHAHYSDVFRSYIALESSGAGREAILLREEAHISPYPGKVKYVELQLSQTKRKHRFGVDLNDPAYFVYDVRSISYRSIDDPEVSKVPHTTVTVVEDNGHDRTKRSRLIDRFRNSGRQKALERAEKQKRVVHIPTLYIESEMDGFQNVFYEEMVTSALCLTSEPGLDRHELVDELEVLLCNNKGYGNLLSPATLKSKRQVSGSPPEVDNDDADDSKEHDNAEDPKWNMNKTHYDTLWKAEQNGTTTPHPLGYDSNSEDSVDYDYDIGAAGGDNATGWEADDIVEDPSGLDYMTWPQFLPEGVKDDDDLRQKFHAHKENFTLDYVRVNLLMGQPEVTFEKRLFALNESTYLAKYYEYFLKLSPYSMKPLISNFFDKRNQTLTNFQKTKLNSTTLRQLFFLFTIDVHHVNCFNRHLRFYGFIMKKPASINGDTITNDVRLGRGIIMRALELIRHVPQYNFYRTLLLRFLIAALKERASLSKGLTTIIGENDYTELYEIASYLEHLLKNGIHPDEVNQDLFVQETRFYSHHFMNTLTL